MSFVSICEGWEGRTVDGKFPLLEWLGGSKNRGVFLTVRQGVQTASIKLILAGGADADAYLARWESTKNLFHPNLTRVMETGRYTIEGNDLVYVVTERAEAALSGIIPRKALDPDKMRVIANRVADALSYVHDKGLVHGSVKPSNILLAADEWKLSGDSVHAAAEAAERVQETGSYDAPEVAEGRVTPASDVWSLGTIVAEALTQRLPDRANSIKGDPLVPEPMPQPFRDVVRGCLRLYPAERFKVPQVLALLAVTAEPATEAAKQEAAEQELVASNPPVFTPPRQRHGLGSTESTADPAYPFGKIEAVEPPLPMSGLFADLEEEDDERGMRVAPIVFGLLVVLAIAAVFLLRGDRWKQFIPTQNPPATSQPVTQAQAPGAPGESQSAPSAGQAAQEQPAASQDKSQSGITSAQADQSQPPAESTPAAPQPQSPPTASSGAPQKGSEVTKAGPEHKSTAPVSHEANTKGAVVERVLPDVSPGASTSMRGPVQVEVRVSVNENGTVSSAEYMSHGPGNYFARISHEAARSWKFKPPVEGGHPRPSVWKLRFNFERKKTEVSAMEVR